MRAAIFNGPRDIRVFDFETDLDRIVEGYKEMDERRAIKSLVRVGVSR